MIEALPLSDWLERLRILSLQPTAEPWDSHYMHIAYITTQYTGIWGLVFKNFRRKNLSPYSAESYRNIVSFPLEGDQQRFGEGDINGFTCLLGITCDQDVGRDHEAAQAEPTPTRCQSRYAQANMTSRAGLARRTETRVSQLHTYTSYTSLRPRTDHHLCADDLEDADPDHG